MNGLEQLQKEINDLKIDANEELLEVLVKLHEQLSHASSAKWSKGDLADLLMSEDDVLDMGVVDGETGLWEDIRDIQHGIINFFGEEKK